MSCIILGSLLYARLQRPCGAGGGDVCLRPAPSNVEIAAHLRPLPQDTMMLLGKKGMDVQAPIFVRIFKEESELEIWKQRDDGHFYHFKTYPICNWSGDLGPKVRYGDRQAPEGFYTITREQMNPDFEVPSGDEPRLPQRVRPVVEAQRRLPHDPRQLQVGRLLRHDGRADRGDLRHRARVLHRRQRQLPGARLSLPHDRTRTWPALPATRPTRSGRP